MVSPCLVQLEAPSAVAACLPWLDPHQCICVDTLGHSQGSLICPGRTYQVLREYRQMCFLLLPNSHMHSAFQVAQSHPLLGKGMEGGLTVRATTGGEGEIPPKMVRELS